MCIYAKNITIARLAFDVLQTKLRYGSELVDVTEQVVSSKPRDVKKILLFRNDISPFLTHLTRRKWGNSAKDNLRSILNSKQLEYKANCISDASFGWHIRNLDSEIKFDYFSAISFTETPLGEIHTLLEVDRSIKLEPYGLVFLKENCKQKGVSPVIYINNMNGDKNDMVQALCSLIEQHSQEASKILPYIAVFGQHLEPVGGTPRNGEIDFTWEREWRYASDDHCFTFEEKDVFIGLCPNREIGNFENEFPWLRFIDPRRNIKWYAEDVVDAIQEHNLEYHVV